jgi:thioredoxin-related protein
MKTILMTVLALGLAAQAMAADSQWLTSVPQALELAKRENKSVLLDFTGSDWCGWCKKLDAETFSKSEFTDYAAKNLVLVEADFPKKPQSAELKAANKALKEKYEVHGYPTLIDLAPDGTVLWKQTGYLAGGPAAMIAKLDAVNPNPTVPRPASAAPAVSEPVKLAAITYPPPVVRRQGDEPRLQGIFWSSAHASVLLEGKSCEEGDSVGGMHVLKIARDKVTVEWQGKTKDLKMN